MQTNGPKVEVHCFTDDGVFPNNARLPVLVYRAVLDSKVLDSNVVDRDALDRNHAGPSSFEQLFEAHDWSGGWRNGVYAFNHYHSTAHEVLGCYSGEATLLLGGPSGSEVKLARGDVVVIPAGVSHRRIFASSDFAVVGAYADGRDYDMRKGGVADRPQVDHNIARLPLPTQDPVFGSKGPLLNHWRG